MIIHVIKRDGKKVYCDGQKIANAIAKAAQACNVELDNIDALTEQVLETVGANGRKEAGVEEIQDCVEHVLMENGYTNIAKAYILYRAEHTKIRKSENDLMDIFRELTFSYAADADIKRENANIDADTAMGTMLKYGSEGAKYFVDNYILPKDIAGAHINGDIHIHDKDFYMLTETCCQIDLKSLFEHGFSTGHGFLRKPNSIISYSALACIAIQANQNEMHGGQSVPAFDVFMAPGVKCTYSKEIRRAVTIVLKTEGKCPCDVKEKLKNAGFEFHLGNKEESAEFLKKTFGFDDKAAQLVLDIATEATDRQTYQAMEAMIHNLNTMNSRAGAQVPFSSLNYGTDTTPEGRMVIKNLLEATDAGLGNGETPIFPVQIFKVKEGVNYNPEDPNYDLFRRSMEVSAKRLFPNYSFLDSPFNLQYYKKGDYNTEVSYMGCRTRVMGNVYDRTKEVTSRRGNLSFTSINLPRLGLKAHGNIQWFYELLDDEMNLVFRQLEHRYKIQATKTVKNYPFLMGQGLWMGSENLGPTDSVGEILKHGTLSIGFIGLAETLIALTGKHHGESEESQKLGLEIISHMRKMCDDHSKEKGMNYTLLATPAEGLSGRFVRIDQKVFGKIPGITDKDYYTNSFHIPVYYNINAYKKIQLEAPYHALTNAGHISYVELDGDTAKNVEAFESIIRCMKDAGIGYGSVNHPVDRDPICGYTGVIDDVCPRCGRHEGEGVSIEKLKELRKQFPNMPEFYGIE